MSITEVTIRKAKNGVVITPILDNVSTPDDEVLVVGDASYRSLFAGDIGAEVIALLYPQEGES